MEDVSGKNPLEIPEILENILGCLPLEDLKSSRLVNKMWRDCAIAPMKKKQKCVLWAGRVTEYPDKTIEDLAEFSKCLNSVTEEGSPNFPCSKIFLNLSLIRRDKNRKKDELVVADFLRKISPWATELWLSMDLQKDLLYKSAFPRRVDFPKLKLLEVCTVGFQGEKSKNLLRKLYQFVTYILGKAPSLQMVDLRDDEHSVDAIIKAKSSSFTELRIYEIKNASMEKLSKWNREVKVKSLDLRFRHILVNGTSLFQFLRSQNDSLETLVLYFRWCCASSGYGIVSFPEMPKLKNLTIQVFYEDHHEYYQSKLVTFPVISYQRHFPALKALHLNPQNLRAISLCQQFIKEDMEPVETLEELTLASSNSNSYDYESWITAENAVRIFPNLKKLEMIADSAMLPTIFEYWTNLEQLTLHPAGYECIDYLLMGHTRSGYKRLQKRIKREGDDFDWNQLEPGNATESILNLQKLTVLRFLNDDEESRKLEVTRASLHLILGRIGSLRCVDFGDRGYPMENKIDKAWWAELKEDCVVLWNNIGTE